MNKKLRGVILLAVGIFVIVWAVNHQPSNAITNSIKGVFDDSSYSMSEPWYYASLVVGGLIALQGLRDFFKGK